MSHFIEKCSYCGDVITQCRCPAPDKELRLGVCKKCEEEGMSEQEWTIHHVKNYPKLAFEEIQKLRESNARYELALEKIDGLLQEANNKSLEVAKTIAREALQQVNKVDETEGIDAKHPSLQGVQEKG